MRQIAATGGNVVISMGLVGSEEKHGKPVWSYFCKKCLSCSCLASELAWYFKQTWIKSV
jgi:hypothetical protein